MIDGKSVLAIIPARSGSKGLPHKNIINLCGKPLIAWPIQAAKKSIYVDRVILSTDDPEIADKEAIMYFEGERWIIKKLERSQIGDYFTDLTSYSDKSIGEG